MLNFICINTTTSSFQLLSKVLTNSYSVLSFVIIMTPDDPQTHTQQVFQLSCKHQMSYVRPELPSGINKVLLTLRHCWF